MGGEIEWRQSNQAPYKLLLDSAARAQQSGTFSSLQASLTAALMND